MENPSEASSQPGVFFNNEHIVGRLKQIEAEHDIEILLACETGSRAWGFPSPDSDYDVRIVYRKPLDWYLTVNPGNDQITAMFDDRMVDVTGWDVRKTFQLLAKSNMSVFERIQSTMVYQSNPEFVEQIRSCGAEYYNPRAAIHHYHGLAKTASKSLSPAEPYSLKKLFYGLRAIAACNWILADDGFPPPLNFFDCVGSEGFPDPIDRLVREVATLKSTAAESYLHHDHHELVDYVLKSIETIDQRIDEVTPRSSKSRALDQLLAKIVTAER